MPTSGRDLIALGISRSRIAFAVEAGQLVRVRRGVFLAADRWPEDPAAQEQKREELEQAALQSAAAVLNADDPYTNYLPPAETADAAHALSGEYEGIGVYIEPTEAGLTIVSPMFGSPAAEAGLKSGDILLAADDQALAGLTAEEAGQHVRGEVTCVKSKGRRRRS